MKTIFLSAAIMAVVILASCAKVEDVPVSDGGDYSNSVAKAPNNNRVIACVETWLGPPFNITTKDCTCSESGGNCLPTVEIVGSASSVLEAFVDSVEMNSVAQFFVGKDYKLLFSSHSDFDANYLSGLRNGTLTFTIADDIEENIVYAALHRSNEVITLNNVGSKAILVFPLKY